MKKIKVNIEARIISCHSPEFNTDKFLSLITVTQEETGLNEQFKQYFNTLDEAKIESDKALMLAKELFEGWLH